MAAGPREQLARLISDVEKAAKQLRADIRKRAQAAPRSLEDAAKRLRKGAAEIAGQVERYVRDLRMNLEGRSTTSRRSSGARRSTARKPTARKSTRRKTARTKRAS